VAPGSAAVLRLRAAVAPGSAAVLRLGAVVAPGSAVVLRLGVPVAPGSAVVLRLEAAAASRSVALIRLGAVAASVRQPSTRDKRPQARLPLPHEEPFACTSACPFQAGDARRLIRFRQRPRVLSSGNPVTWWPDNRASSRYGSIHKVLHTFNNTAESAASNEATRTFASSATSAIVKGGSVGERVPAQANDATQSVHALLRTLGFGSRSRTHRLSHHGGPRGAGDRHLPRPKFQSRWRSGDVSHFQEGGHVCPNAQCFI
jgi:hypothetical protein